MRTFVSLLTICNLLAPISKGSDFYNKMIVDLQEYRELMEERKSLDQKIQAISKSTCVNEEKYFDICSDVFEESTKVLEKWDKVNIHLQGIYLDYIDQFNPYGEINLSILEELESRYPMGSTNCNNNEIQNTIKKSEEMIYLIKRVEKLGYKEDVLNITGTDKIRCDQHVKSNCWMIDKYGNIIFITKKGLKVHSSCLFKDERGKYRPAQVIASSNEAVEKIKKCYKKINPDRSDEISKKINSLEYIMMCKTKLGSDKSHTCGNAVKGDLIFNLFFNDNCNGMAETIFHELLHLNGSVDNLRTHNHNDGQCKKHDAVYFCSRYCFPKSRRHPIKFTQDACLRCIRNPREKNRCNNAKYESRTYDQTYQNCGAL